MLGIASGGWGGTVPAHNRRRVSLEAMAGCCLSGTRRNPALVPGEAWGQGFAVWPVCLSPALPYLTKPRVCSVAVRTGWTTLSRGGLMHEGPTTQHGWVHKGLVCRTSVYGGAGDGGRTFQQHSLCSHSTFPLDFIRANPRKLPSSPMRTDSSGSRTVPP